MAQHSRPAARTAASRTAAQPAAALPADTGFRSWNRERRIYLAVGILACIAGVLIIAFSR
jgi:hypothetical protein